MKSRSVTKDCNLDAEVAFLAQREFEERERMVAKYTDDDLVAAWGYGYQARVTEEEELFEGQ